MIGALTGVLAVMMMTGPDDVIDVEATAAAVADAGSVTDDIREARVVSRSSDFDRQEGVVLYEGNVFVTYSDDYAMSSDRLYMFLSNSNELSRVVAVGNVTITNETRIGSCAMAVYRRARGEIEMYWDGKAKMAKLVETGRNAGELEGTRVKFWLDSEQVEVENSRIKIDREGGGGLL